MVGEGVYLEHGMVLDLNGGAMLAAGGGADSESILDSGLHVCLGLEEAMSVDCLLLELLKSNDSLGGFLIRISHRKNRQPVTLQRLYVLPD